MLGDLESSRPPALSIGDFAANQRALGWNYSPYDILKDPWLKDIVDVPSHNCFDWAHNILQGILQAVIDCAMRGISSSGIKAKHVEAYLSMFQWPRR
eukprot:6243076-Pyramimonas_sp.AAC.1